MNARAKRYTSVRRLVLAASTLFVVGVPAWHLARFAADGTLASARGTAIAERLSPSGVPYAVGAPWSANVWGIEFLDPLAALGVAVASGPTAALLIATFASLVLIVIFGRFFCGWLCPYVPILAASKAARSLLEKLGLRPRDVQFERSLPIIVLVALLLITAISGSQVVPLLYPPSVVGREVFKAIFLGGFGLGMTVVIAAFCVDTFVSRAGFCRSLCPGGAVFSLLGLMSFVTVKRDEEACIDCGICDRVCGLGQLPMTDVVGAGCERCGTCVNACPTDALSVAVASRPALLVEIERQRSEPLSASRRTFVAAAGASALGLVALHLPSAAPPRLRPPGAAPGSEFERRCIRCFRCAEVCPVAAIRFDSTLDLRGSDTPYIDSRQQPCVLCMACTTACPTGALTPIADDIPAIAATVRMGTPVLSKARCIAWNGRGECNACWQVCPLPDVAVTLVADPRQGPEFDVDKCVGCGLCEHACPQRARAITIRPRGTS